MSQERGIWIVTEDIHISSIDAVGTKSGNDTEANYDTDTNKTSLIV